MAVDALMPREMAVRAENAGVAKAGLEVRRMFALAILAGAFIALGADFATVVWAGSGSIAVNAGKDVVFTTGIPYGLQRLLGGIVFSTGLIMVVVGGSELFTGNCLIPMAWVSGRISMSAVLRNWAIVYAGNFVGSVLTALFVFLGRQHTFGGGGVGLVALNIAVTKTGLGFLQCTFLAILCNALVCMAVWLCFSARSTTDKILSILPPITAFVACGFEHCVANMYFIPSALFIRDWDATYFATVASSLKDGGSILTWGNFLLRNLIPATIGNIIGGTLMVGGVYWFIYLRKGREDRNAAQTATGRK
jgi:formate/nitrite transporter